MFYSRLAQSMVLIFTLILKIDEIIRLSEGFFLLVQWLAAVVLSEIIFK